MPEFGKGEKIDRKVIFAHAKASAVWKPCSASALQEVCGQATKNARYLGKFAQDVPPRAMKWHNQQWKLGALGPFPRVRHPTGTNKEVWTMIRKAIRDMRSNNEIWIVLGQILSKSELLRQLTSKPAPREAVQAAYLLFTAAQAAYAVNAKLRVLCSP